MTDEQIKILKGRLSLKDGRRLLWIRDGCNAFEIRVVGQQEGEPSEVGRFGDGTYIALYNVDPDEIFESRRLFP